MAHEIYQYQEGYQTVEYCRKCGKGNPLSCDPCEPLEKECPICGHIKYQAHCENCKKIRLSFKRAIDKTNSRN